MWGQPCPPRSGHSLDVAVVEGAVVVHLQREHLLTGIWGQGTALLPPPSTRARGAPKPPLSGLQVPTHQVKVTAVAQVVAQRVLGDVVALAAHQLPVHLGEERWGKDTCRDRTWSTHPPWGDPQTGDSPVPNSPPTERKSRAELTPAERLLNLCSWCRMPPITMHRPLGTENPPQNKTPISAPLPAPSQLSVPPISPAQTGHSPPVSPSRPT